MWFWMWSKRLGHALSACVVCCFLAVKIDPSLDFQEFKPAQSPKGQSTWLPACQRRAYTIQIAKTLILPDSGDIPQQPDCGHFKTPKASHHVQSVSHELEGTEQLCSKDTIKKQVSPKEDLSNQCHSLSLINRTALAHSEAFYDSIQRADITWWSWGLGTKSRKLAGET